VAGLKKMMGKDPIGVRGDNIFKMIRRRYQKKRADRNFIEGAPAR